MRAQENVPERAAIYCRISDDREGRGLGVARQEDDCRKLAERLGWEVAKLYRDTTSVPFEASGVRRTKQCWTM